MYSAYAKKGERVKGKSDILQGITMGPEQFKPHAVQEGIAFSLAELIDVYGSLIAHADLGVCRVLQIGMIPAFPDDKPKLPVIFWKHDRTLYFDPLPFLKQGLVVVIREAETSAKKVTKTSYIPLFDLSQLNFVQQVVHVRQSGRSDHTNTRPWYKPDLNPTHGYLLEMPYMNGSIKAVEPTDMKFAKDPLFVFRVNQEGLILAMSR